MPFLDKAVKVSFLFDLESAGAVEEIAEFGIWGPLTTVPGAGAPTDTVLQDLAHTMHDSFVANFDKGLFNAITTLRTVSATMYNGLGKTVAQGVFVGPSWAGEGVGCLPWQDALCVGLYSYTPGSFIANAKSRRGRIYLPPLAAEHLSPANTGLIKQAVVDRALASVHDLLTLAPTGGALEAVWTPSVYSRKEGVMWPLTDLTCDTKVDTMRSRSKNMVAVRTTVSLS